MNVIVFGATRGIGRAVARALVERGDRVCLLGRNPEELDRSAKDLQCRGNLEVQPVTIECDLTRPEMFASALDLAGQALGKVDAVVVTAATFSTQELFEQDVDLAQQNMTVNFVNTVMFCEHVRKRLVSSGGGTLCVVSSVAGDRGRSPVVIYGAAKAGLTAYLEALDQRYFRYGLRAICIKPGFVRTAMTSGLRVPPFAGTATRVARDIVRAIDRGRTVVYTPAIWKWIMVIVRLLPRALMRRSSF